MQNQSTNDNAAREAAAGISGWKPSDDIGAFFHANDDKDGFMRKLLGLAQCI